MMRSDLSHSWEEIEAAERKVSEEAAEQKMVDYAVEVPQKKSEKEQRTESLDSICPGE